MEMLEIMKARMPEGLEIKKIQNRANASQIKIWFTYEDIEVVGYLSKTCTPGAAEKVADYTIDSAMMAVGLKRKDLEMAEYWLAKTMGVGQEEQK